MSKLKHNCVTEFSSYSYTYEWKISNVNCRLDKLQPLQCPEKIRSPRGKNPATEWQLEALGLKGNNSGQNQPPNSWIVKLTLNSPSSVWVRVQLKTKVRDSTRTLLVSPRCTAPHSVNIHYRGHITGYIPIAQYGENIHPDYLYGQDLILSLNIAVIHLDSPVHATRSVAEAEIVQVPKFDLSMIMEEARQRD